MQNIKFNLPYSYTSPIKDSFSLFFHRHVSKSDYIHVYGFVNLSWDKVGCVHLVYNDYGSDFQRQLYST